MPIAKSTITIKGVLMLLTAVICMSHLRSGPSTLPEKVDEYYVKQIRSLREKLTDLKDSCQKKASLKHLRERFIESRLAYKKLAVLSEYFNIYETRFLNGPALNRTEDGTPDIVIPPQGFQAMEEIIFGVRKPTFQPQLVSLLNEMLVMLNRLENEPGRLNKFRTELVWDAVRSSTVRLISLGITGFDSPIAHHSISEARASIEGLGDILTLFKTEIGGKNDKATDSLFRLLKQADAYLFRHNDFEGFDRLIFISEYMNPFYEQLYRTRFQAGISIPEGQSPVNLNASSIFGADFFNVNYFSPGKDYWKTEKRIELGKRLFSDPILSGTKDRSCASCHQPAKAFADGLKVPISLDKKRTLSRNTPTLWNAAIQSRQFYDSRTDLLENQLDEVVHNSDEMSGSLKENIQELVKLPEYVHLFDDAYPNEVTPINAFNIANAISSYVRSLISLNSRFDRYMSGEKSLLTTSEQKGFNLFTGKAKCATCHFIPLFNGLVPAEFTETETEVLGVPGTNSKRNATLDGDLGKYNITRSVVHRFSFKTSSLRNIELTGPYMHNGIFNTLEEVMDFYNEGGGAGLKIAPENQTLPSEKLKLTRREIRDIVSFMKALTDSTIAPGR